MASAKIDETLAREVAESGLFDARWYCATYRDVPAIAIPALDHYIRFGAVMGRAPGPCFDGNRYLADHHDVGASGMNPLLHYIRHGKSEGRRIRSVGTKEEVRTVGLPLPAPRLAAFAKLPLTVLVITWDVGHNPLGRSYMLAEVLDRVVRNVVIAGFQFSRYGSDIWEPVRTGRLPVISLPGADMPEFLDSLEKLSQRMRPDVVIACKPRLPSLQLAALIKHQFGCPMVLDIDDHELSFFKGGEEVGLSDLEAMADGAAAAQTGPYDELWTRVAQSMRGYADEIIVSNVALQDEFGGTIVTHVRDEERFDPALHDRQRSREKYDIPAGAKVVLFFGTPRQHKGINVLAQAVASISDPDFRLVLVGTATDKAVTANLNALAGGRLICIPNQPFSSIPEILAMADVVCLPQDEGNPISRFQLPAKAIDAVAMGIPLLVAPTPPLMQLVKDGVATAIDLKRLPEMLQAAATHGRAKNGLSGRDRFLQSYSYSSAATSLREVILRARKNVDFKSICDLPKLLSQQRRLLGRSDPPTAKPKTGIDIVVFWKQNDSGMYGRRSDMIIRYLASRPDVRQVLVLDAPISEHELVVRRNKTGPTHDRMIYTKTYEKRFGKLDTPKVTFDVFIYPPGLYRNSDDNTSRTSLSDAYERYLEETFLREDIDAARSVFWFYPKNYHANSLISRFAPAKVVVDVVDDHRAWPGISDLERSRLTEHYRRLLAMADMSFANCRPVVEAMREFSPAIRLVPNGCDDSQMLVAPKHNPSYQQFLSFPGKTIGFIGNLEKKIDIELIEKIALRFPSCQVALLGSTHANPEVLQLSRYANVRMVGVVPYREIGTWVSHLDVGIIPHIDMELTRSMNPLKLYVYLAWGVPVVSTEVQNIDRSTTFVKVAASHDGFLAHVANLLDSPDAVQTEELVTFVRENSWSTRMAPHVDQLLRSFDELGL